MGKKYKLLAGIILVVLAGVFLQRYLSTHSLAVLTPKGEIASKERSLIIESTLLMLVVVVPVFLMTFFFSWRYRAGNKKAKYTPDWDHHGVLESIWWAFPMAIILILSVVTWHSSHELDPFKALDSKVKPMTVQVVALQWRWLFIYPEQNVASINHLQMPVNTPINLQITADAPMNSFWIPSLGGQVYAMSGMKTQLHLVANQAGSYRGSSANLSGRGFSGMNFIAEAGSNDDFDAWVSQAKKSSKVLNLDEYNKLAAPSTNDNVAYYSAEEPGLYDSVIHKFMAPQITSSSSTAAHSHGGSY
jgi:cytochrome o ubiquinol oxidase subunit 2